MNRTPAHNKPADPAQHIAGRHRHARNGSADRPIRVLAICSSGGHWEQMMTVRDAFDGFEVFYATTLDGLAQCSGVGQAKLIPDFNASRPLKAVLGIWPVAATVISCRPDIVVSTGAAPGLIALIVAKLFGMRTLWIDSVANADKLSLSGRLAGLVADMWLTQWEHLAKPRGPKFSGRAL